MPESKHSFSIDVFSKLEYSEELAKAAGKPDPKKVADEAIERGLLEFNASQRWLDVKGEIKLKKAPENVMRVSKNAEKGSTNMGHC